MSGFKSQCGYCGARNDIDFGLLQSNPAESSGPVLPCPLGHGPLANLNVVNEAGGGLRVEKCETCYGLFFDAFKLETILTNLAKFGFSIQAGRLQDLSAQPNTETTVSYRKCPVCAKLMNRENFGSRSGVVTDRCGDHGTWLDAGELKRLVEWMDAGGGLHHAEVKKEMDRQQANREKREKEKQRKRREEADRDSRGHL